MRTSVTKSKPIQQQQQQIKTDQCVVEEQKGGGEMKRIHHVYTKDDDSLFFYNSYDDSISNEQYNYNNNHDRKQPCYMDCNISMIGDGDSSTADQSNDDGNELFELLGWFLPNPDQYSQFFNPQQIQQLLQLKQLAEEEEEENEDEELQNRLQPFNITSPSSTSPQLSPLNLIKCNHEQCLNLPAFSSITSYENHYYSVHCYECSICSKSLPSYKWLECHVLEVHDKMFAQLALKHQLFDCIVNDCNQRFWTDRLRKDHLVQFHRFPTSFEFHQQPLLDQMIVLHNNIIQHQLQLHQQQQQQQRPTK